MKNFRYEGRSLTWTNDTGADVSSGDVVVVGSQIGVAAVDIADGASGTVVMEGVFALPKVSAAVIAQGESVIWDASEGACEDDQATPATGDVSGACTAWEDAAATTTTVLVKINTGVGTVA
jgi:predicted RecA/RadA family phage recombinase